VARSQRLIEKARGQGTFRSESGAAHPTSYTLEVRQEIVDGLPGKSEIKGFVTLPAAVVRESRRAGVLELKDGRTTDVTLLLGEAPAGEEAAGAEAKVRFRGGPLRAVARY
jgi:hypothetical protein